mmetsp:Transcript_86987/g.223948  ORF Transcript_86987/g.223948 Transcript_86987/m.223948 type:complete len:235 (+) Transcript_86987:666-1370(+)
MPWRRVTRARARGAPQRVFVRVPPRPRLHRRRPGRHTCHLVARFPPTDELLGSLLLAVGDRGCARGLLAPLPGRGGQRPDELEVRQREAAAGLHLLAHEVAHIHTAHLPLQVPVVRHAAALELTPRVVKGVGRAPLSQGCTPIPLLAIGLQQAVRKAVEGAACNAAHGCARLRRRRLREACAGAFRPATSDARTHTASRSGWRSIQPPALELLQAVLGAPAVGVAESLVVASSS